MLEHIPPTLGRLLKNIRPGLDKLTYFDPLFKNVPETIQVTSPSFKEGGRIPVDYTSDGKKISPAIEWHGVSENAQSVALIIEDADSPTPTPFVHAIVLNLPGHDMQLSQGALTTQRKQWDYLPPDPPAGHGPHHYAFEVFALNIPLKLSESSSKEVIKSAMAHHVIAKGCLIGIYERKKNFKV